jgi:hypothetical protein
MSESRYNLHRRDEPHRLVGAMQIGGGSGRGCATVVFEVFRRLLLNEGRAMRLRPQQGSRSFGAVGVSSYARVSGVRSLHSAAPLCDVEG